MKEFTILFSAGQELRLHADAMKSNG